MKIKSAEFAASSPGLEECPESELPEVAFIGRSNVGKSSLINMLTGKKDLAIVSQTPGRTRLINFFVVNGEWCLVDLPGYGYAKAPKKERHRFEDFVADYLANRSNLSLVLVLIDCRLPPQLIDLEFLSWLANFEVPFTLVFTKADKLKEGKRKANIKAFMEALSEWVIGEVPALVTSAQTGAGRQDVLHFIDATLVDNE